MKKGILFTDGACKGNPGPMGIGIIIKDEFGHTIKQHNEYLGPGTNNIAEYTALLRGLQLSKKEGITHLDCFVDSQLLAKHVNGQYNVQAPQLVALMNDIRNAMRDFESVSVKHVLRHMNAEADYASNLAFKQERDSL
jgi:ribonuclease HI